MKNQAKKLEWLQPELRDHLLNHLYKLWNVGVFGGNDIEFIQEYCKGVFDIIDNNNLWEENESVYNNMIFEQVWLYVLSQLHNKEFATILDLEWTLHREQVMSIEDYDNQKIVHLLGIYKKYLRLCKVLEQIVKERYPEYYERVINFIES